MPKGDGQGGNNRPEDLGPRSPDEILLRRIATHEQNIKDGFDAAFQTEMIARCREQLKQLKAEPWPLEAMERCDPLKRSLASLGLGERACDPLERYGVIWAGELCQWTEPMLYLVQNLGAKAVADIRAALAQVGLKLREPVDGEEPVLPPLQNEGRIASRASTRLAPSPARNQELARQRKMLVSLAGGATQREAEEAARLCAKRCSPAANLKSKIREDLRRGKSAAEIAASLGFPPASPLGGSILAYLESLLPKS